MLLPSVNAVLWTSDDLLKKVLLEVLPMINEANAISEELEKNCKFEVALIPPRLEGRKTEASTFKPKQMSWFWGYAPTRNNKKTTHVQLK